MIIWMDQELIFPQKWFFHVSWAFFMKISYKLSILFIMPQYFGQSFERLNRKLNFKNPEFNVKLNKNSLPKQLTKTQRAG